MYSLGTRFVSGICVWIPCIKETMMIIIIIIIITKCLSLEIALHAPLTVHENSFNIICPVNMVCFRYTIVNTLYKGGHKCNNNINNNEQLYWK
jgi:hypothetical protein